MNVLHLTHSLDRGGIQKWLITINDHLLRHGVRTSFLCKSGRQGDLAQIVIDQGSRVYTSKLTPLHLGYVRRLKHTIKDDRIDIIHNHLQLYSWIGTYVAHNCNIPCITSFHNTRFAPQTWVGKPIIRNLRSMYGKISVRYSSNRSEYITGCSQAVLDVIRREYHTTPQRERVLYYGVDIPSIPSAGERSSFRDSIGLAPDARLCLHVGSYSEQKNHRRVLEVFRRIRQHVPSACLLLVGEGPLRPEIEDLIEHHELQPFVRLLGWRDDVLRLMSFSDVFLFPSHFEGFGLVALEANAAGLAVIGSRIPGITEAIEDGVTGWLYPPGEVGSMAEAAVRVLRDRDLASAVQAEARARARERFTTEGSALSLLELYHDCLSNS